MRAKQNIEKVTKDCEYCGTAVTRAPSLMKGFRFCSMACRRAGQRASKICEHCGSQFSRPVSKMTDKKRFCSKACYDVHQTTGKREKFICEGCGVPFIRRESYQRGKPRRFCSDRCQRVVMVRECHPRWQGGTSRDSDGIELIYMPREGVASSYIRTHRWVASESVERLVERHEHILHLNKNNDDHRPENLFVCGSVSECVKRINGSLSWPVKSNIGETIEGTSNTN